MSINNVSSYYVSKKLILNKYSEYDDINIIQKY